MQYTSLKDINTRNERFIIPADYYGEIESYIVDIFNGLEIDFEDITGKIDTVKGVYQHFIIGNHDKALFYYERASLVSARACENILFIKEDLEDTLKYASKAIEIEPDRSPAYVMLSTYYSKKGEIDGVNYTTEIITNLILAIERKDCYALLIMAGIFFESKLYVNCKHFIEYCRKDIPNQLHYSKKLLTEFVDQLNDKFELEYSQTPDSIPLDELNEIINETMPLDDNGNLNYYEIQVVNQSSRN